MGQGPTLIPADNPGPYTGAGNNTWLLDGAEPTLIDAGTGVSTHVDAVASRLGGRPLARVIVTHGHSDHASGVPGLRARWPGLDVRKYVLDGESGWSALVDGEWIAAGDGELQVLHTPGHAADHLCLWDAEASSLFGGDMVVWPGSVLIPGGRGGDLRAYLDSLRLLESLAPVRIYPGHGPIIERPLDVIAEYLEHRQRRDEQILILVAEGYRDAESIARQLYGALGESLDRAARMTVQAHLDKLEADGRLPAPP